MQIGSNLTSNGALINGGTIKSPTQQGQLGMNDFFTLMAAQLQNQDPSQPTDNSQYMAQMAQFGALEQLTNISSALSFSSASSVVGKNVQYSHMDSQTGKTITGKGVVSSVDVTGNTPTCTINGNVYNVSEITDILASDGTVTPVKTDSGTQSVSSNLADLAEISRLSNLVESAQLMGNDSSSNSQSTNDSLFGTSATDASMF